MNKQKLSLALIALSTIIGLSVYPLLAEEAGFWGIFALPMITACAMAFMHYIPQLDPLKKNVSKFKDEYVSFQLVVITFLSYAHVLLILKYLGFTFNLYQLLSIGVAVLMYYSGVLCTKTKRNWFIGIKTPWTLSDDKVWDATHARAGKLFQYAAIVPLFGILFPQYLIYLIIVPVISLVIYSGIFSYHTFENK